MAEVPATTTAEVMKEHAAELHAPYLKVWAALAVLTAIEYIYAYQFKDWFVILLLGLLIWAVIKAGLVGWFFMHLKFEGPWVYILIIPAAVLATILVLGLTPDVAFKPATEENPEEESVRAVPAVVRPLGESPPAFAWAVENRWQAPIESAS
jgi:cytochrome c oxidase subunit 4